MNLKELKNKIEKKELKGSVLFYGEEDYLKKFYINEIRKKYIDKDKEVFCFLNFDGKLNIKVLSDFINTPSFFSEHKLCIIQNSELFKSKKRINKDIDTDYLVEMISDLPDYIIVVFSENALDKRLMISKAFKKHGTIIEFNEQDTQTIKKWLLRSFKDAGKTIANDVLEYMLMVCDSSMNSLLHETEKLVSYANERQEIIKSDIDKVCIRTLKSRVFDLIDTLGSNNIKKTYTILNELREQREAEQKVIVLIERQLRLLYGYNTLKDSGIPDGEIMKKLKQPPFLGRKLSKQAKLFSINKLKGLIDICHKVDIESKTGLMKASTGLDIIISSIIKNETTP
jgi:DNA polymerase-3 subunit delta